MRRLLFLLLLLLPLAAQAATLKASSGRLTTSPLTTVTNTQDEVCLSRASVLFIHADGTKGTGSPTWKVQRRSAKSGGTTWNDVALSQSVAAASMAVVGTTEQSITIFPAAGCYRAATTVCASSCSLDFYYDAYPITGSN